MPVGRCTFERTSLWNHGQQDYQYHGCGFISAAVLVHVSPALSISCTIVVLECCSSHLYHYIVAYSTPVSR